jgi:hypothetical protein
MHDSICPAWSESKSPDGLCHNKLGSTGNYDAVRVLTPTKGCVTRSGCKQRRRHYHTAPVKAHLFVHRLSAVFQGHYQKTFCGCIGPITLILHGLGPDVRPRARVARSNRPSRTDSDSKSVLDRMSHAVLTYLDSARTVSAKSSGYCNHVLR